MDFNVNALDNVPINRRLKLTFSEAVDPSTVMVVDPTSDAYRQGTGSVQIRMGTTFGLSAAGTFSVEGSTVYFDPVVPGRCDLSDAGLQAGTTYRVTVMGSPEEFAVRSSRGQPLEETRSFEFTTLRESDPERLEDQAPGQLPVIVALDPEDGSAAVPVRDGNHVTIAFSENLDPCGVSGDTVRLYMAQTGDPASFLDTGTGHASGFSPIEDANPDPYDWGSTLAHRDVAPLQRIPSTVVLDQDFERTVVTVTPLFGKFPENALLVVELTFGILDFEGYPLSPTTISFTTENLAPQTSTLLVDFDRSSEPIDDVVTTADIDTDRSPSRAQGWLLFAGDGDNGADDHTPSFPFTPTNCSWTPNQDGPDDFDPLSDVVLDTGATHTECTNSTDGSHAVVWEFATFRIRPGVTVRIQGQNPAIILVRGDVLIESGGRLLARGSGSLDPDGGDAVFVRGGPPTSSTPGRGVAGGGDGGACHNKRSNYGDDGWAGYGSPDAYQSGGTGAGQGGVAVTTTTSASGGAGGGGGGGGHSSAGDDGLTAEHMNAEHVDDPRSYGGGQYGADWMYTPSAGSGGGAGGYLDHSTWFGNDNGNATGGGGGAGGGFVDITAGGDMRIHGVIDASGGSGGNGIGIASRGNYLMHTGTGGGGSGGGIRLLTPGDMDVSGATLNTAGGLHGVYPPPPYWQPITVNHGGDGSPGRIVLEDGDSVILGLSSASVVPGEGVRGFYRHVFDPNRFSGGSAVPRAVTGALFVGPMSAPVFRVPEAADFVAGIPTAATPGFGSTAMLVECQGYGMSPGGTPDPDTATGWVTIGYFRESGSPDAPGWVEGANPGDVAVPPGNVGAGISRLDGCAFLKVRVSIYLPLGISPFTPGPFVEDWELSFQHDQ